MFGGLAFLLNGNMCCGVTGDRLMLRLGEDGAREALAEPHARPMDFTGKPMKSMIYVEPAGIASEEDLRKWVGRAVAFAASLPAKN
jgi:TfoX/Sxy family transcriptional regulator of competence genes